MNLDLPYTVSKNGCFVFTGCKDIYGYGKVKRKQKQWRAHRYAWTRANGEIPEDMILCHTCDNTSCINPEHLFVGTHQDNSDDKVRKGRHRNGDQKGERNGYAKLNKSQVCEIKTLIKKGLNNRQIGRIYGVSGSNISLIRLGKTWN